MANRELREKTNFGGLVGGEEVGVEKPNEREVSARNSMETGDTPRYTERKV